MTALRAARLQEEQKQRHPVAQQQQPVEEELSPRSKEAAIKVQIGLDQPARFERVKRPRATPYPVSRV